MDRDARQSPVLAFAPARSLFRHPRTMVKASIEEAVLRPMYKLRGRLKGVVTALPLIGAHPVMITQRGNVSSRLSPAPMEPSRFQPHKFPVVAPALFSAHTEIGTLWIFLPSPPDLRSIVL